MTRGPWCSSQPGFGTPGVLASRTSQGLRVSPLQWKSGSLTSNILLPPSTCLHVTRNEAVTTCSSSRWSLSPCISAHDLACLFLPLFPLSSFLISLFLSLFLPFLLEPPPTLEFSNRGTLEEGPWVYDQHLQSAHYWINQSIPPREDLAWIWECFDPCGREGQKFHTTETLPLTGVTWGIWEMLNVHSNTLSFPNP